VCNFGILNYYIGKRAADEGRTSAYPDIDFCKDPGAVCSRTEYPELKWIGESNSLLYLYAISIHWMDTILRCALCSHHSRLLNPHPSNNRPLCIGHHSWNVLLDSKCPNLRQRWVELHG